MGPAVIFRLQWVTIVLLPASEVYLLLLGPHVLRYESVLDGYMVYCIGYLRQVKKR